MRRLTAFPSITAMYFFRVDASQQIGTGHLMRCLTLADALRKQGASTHFVCRHISADLADMVMQAGHQLIRLPGQADGDIGALAHSAWLGTSQAQDGAETAAAMAGHDCDWLIVDHYALDASWQRMMRPHASRICVIDDLADRQHDCDVLLDQNLYLNADQRYQDKVPGNCRKLLGPQYALLRDEFTDARRLACVRGDQVRRILISFGGIDAANYTSAAVQALSKLHLVDVQVDVVIGASHPFREAIIEACKDFGFFCHVQTKRMAQLMLDADLAIAAGGSSSWERCCVGLPSMVVAVADNQRQLTHDAACLGLLHAPNVSFADPEPLAAHLRMFLDSPLLARHISHVGMAHVDGRGVARVLRELGASTVHIRRAALDDSRALFEWRNHPAIRAVSTQTAPLDYARHEQWVAAVLSNTDRPLLIGEQCGDPIGVVRFDIVEDCAEVSIYLVPGVTGAGQGSDLLAAAECWLRRNRPDVATLRATVLDANTASHRLFLRSGYQPIESLYSKRLLS